MAKYDFQKIERKWQKYWRDKKVYEPDLKSAKKPFYNLMMFPYPSAEGLHVGNMYAFTGADIYGRMKRMQGHDVFEPIGLDGFGIHSENYALKIKAHPMEQAKVSEERFYKQLESIGNGFAWDEKIETYDPEYYKWTQWIFIQMFKNGLAYRAKASVNWCSSCKTVLADEQVVAGKCERCGTEVEKKELEQWFFKITKYAEKLLENLEKIDWSERVKIAQRNWIGKSEGAEIKFPISNSQFSITVFTTRPDTLFGATYLVLAPEHWWLEQEILNPKSEILNKPEIQKYLKKTKNKSEAERIAEGREKTGVELKGIKAINPANKEEIPVFVADHVLGGVGTGAIMAVPAHDQRDFEFAKKFKLPIREVVVPNIIDRKNPPLEGKKVIERKNIHAIVRDPATNKYLALKWKKFDWVTFPMGGVEDGEDVVEAAKREVREETGFTNLKFIKVLEGQARAEYFAAHKDENRIAYTTAVIFDLIDYKQEEVSEKEKDAHEVIWLDKSKLNYENMSHAEVDLWNERINSGLSAYVGGGVLIESDKFSGLDSEKAKWEITKFVGGKIETHYRLRDWLISRQRYWGPPIPMIFCEKCDWQPVPEEDLPVELPFVKDFRPRGKGESPLASDKSFYETKCPKCGGKARRETDVSDTFLDSAWYYIGYLAVAANPKSQIPNPKQIQNLKSKIPNSPFSNPLTKRWLPVNLYTGGAEHSVLHLLYVRFLALALYDEKLLEFGKSESPKGEPFPRFRAHGLLIKEGAKMSKSKGNVINPDEYIKNFGADTLRMYLMFLAPFEYGGDFRDAGILGPERFLIRVYDFFEANKDKFLRDLGLSSRSIIADPENLGTKRQLAKSVRKITEDIENLHYNTAISTLMTLLYYFEADCRTYISDAEDFLKLLAPFAPHIAEEIWQNTLEHKDSIHLSGWPEYDPKLIKEETFELVVQINGKHRATITAEVGLSQKEAEELVVSNEKAKSFLENKKVKKIIFIKDRLVNFVV